jgi:hypothetical protein
MPNKGIIDNEDIAEVNTGVINIKLYKAKAITDTTNNF